MLEIVLFIWKTYLTSEPKNPVPSKKTWLISFYSFCSPDFVLNPPAFPESVLDNGELVQS